MRTVRRQAHPINAGKRGTLAALVRAYAAEKQHWLQVFAQRDTRHLIERHRDVRDAAVARGHLSASGLQARMWKLALTDAAETWGKYWQGLFVEVRRKIARRQDFDDAQRHYANWLLSGYAQFFACLDGQSPEPKFKVAADLRPKVAGYVRRTVANLRGRQPSIKTARSAVLDADCYSVFTEGGTQYIKLMTLEPRRRIALPLKGQAAITGNIRIVIVRSGVEVHVPQALPKKSIDTGVVAAVDFGYTEAMTDADGNGYGNDLRRIITAASNERNVKGKARNRLRAVAEKHEASGNPARLPKARHIRRLNLGKVKWLRREHKSRAAIACEINAGLNRLIKKQQPCVLVTEDLRHTFTFDRPKDWNRKLSAWAKGVLQDRTEFKALAEGFRHEQVNPAYGSQTCPCCGCVDAKNRSGDRFKCLHCGRQGHADQIAATNILSRHGDREITRYTPCRDVKTVLLGRFRRRLEMEDAALAAPDRTVPGRTSDVVTVRPHAPAKKKRITDPATTRRAKQSKNGVAGSGDYV